MGDTTRGLYSKFDIYRTDGKSGVGQKHHGCDYFVLDLTHDPHARAAVAAYAASCCGTYPLLAADLNNKLARSPFGWPGTGGNHAQYKPNTSACSRCGATPDTHGQCFCPPPRARA